MFFFLSLKRCNPSKWFGYHNFFDNLSYMTCYHEIFDIKENYSNHPRSKAVSQYSFRYIVRRHM